nr:hypothetical protein CFP56_35067 [Quercus suber]
METSTNASNGVQLGAIYVGSCSNADSGNLDNSDDNATKRRKICPEDDQDGETKTASNNSGKTSGTCLSPEMPDTNLDSGHVLSLVKLTRSGLLLFTFPRNTPADTVGIVSNIMESVESGISKSPLWCHRIFPIQETCSLNEKELQTVVSKLVFQFMNDKQHKVSHPVKFAVVKTAVSDSVVDLKSPEFSVLVELLPLSGVPNGSLVVAVSVLPQNLVNTKPRLCIKALVFDSKAKGGKH